MRPDVQELSDFYRGPLGMTARHLLAHRLRTLWPDVRGETVLGLGYAAPFMRPFLREASRVIVGMPEEQGAVQWPLDGPIRSFLADEMQLPLRDASVDRVLAVHCLEMSGSAAPLLREIWRVLAPEGRLLLIVPNRRGLWARFDTTPFGHGHPYSRRQLEKLLGGAFYQPTGWSPSLFLPPINRRIVLNTAVAWERVGLYGWPGFSGVLMVEAQKHLYAPVGKKAKRFARHLRPAASKQAPAMGRSSPDSGPNAKNSASTKTQPARR